MGKELKKCLDEWARRCGVSSADADDDGVRFLVFDNKYEIRLSQIGRTVYLAADLGRLPEGRAAAGTVLDRLMALQLSCSQGAAEVLALDDESANLVLFRRLEAGDLDLSYFDLALSHFVNELEFFKRQIDQLRQPHVSPFSPPAVVHA